MPLTHDQGSAGGVSGFDLNRQRVGVMVAATSDLGTFSSGLVQHRNVARHADNP